VQAALEFSAADADGGPVTSDVWFILYNAPVTCADVTAAGGRVPAGVTRILFGEVMNYYGLSLEGASYTIPEASTFGFPSDSVSLVYRDFFPDGGYQDTGINDGGTVTYNSPVTLSTLTGSVNVTVEDGSNLSGTFDATYCLP
jgi:hypothetical protein